jgi:hypothetical protein
MRLLPATTLREPIAVQDVVAGALALLCCAGLALTVRHLAEDWRAAGAQLAADRALLAAQGMALPGPLPGPPIDAATARAALEQMEARIHALDRARAVAALRLARVQGEASARRDELAPARAEAEAHGLARLPDHTFDPGPEPSLGELLSSRYWTWSAEKRLCDAINPLIRALDGLTVQERALQDACASLAGELAAARAARAGMLDDMAHAVDIARELSARSTAVLREAEASSRDDLGLAAARRELRASPWTRLALVALHLPVALYFLALGLRFGLRLAVLRRWLKPQRIAV